jgi:hypothetical protein
LVKTDAGFEPRAVEELNGMLGRTFGRAVDCAVLLPGLLTVARALNDGDLARAMIATTFMRLPYLDEDEARRAAAAVALSKASEDDPKHPGWPKGTPGGRGGEFRPKDALSEGSKQIVKLDVSRRLVLRGAIREALLRKISPRRILRLTGEAASNAIPGLNVAADIALITDLAVMASEFATLKRDTDAAIEFIKKAPYRLEDLRVDPQDRSFGSYPAFKKIDLLKFYGPAGAGFEYHHIVRQSAKGEITLAELNSTRNIIRIPRILHEEISSIYSRRNGDANPSRRDAIDDTSFERQFKDGLKILRDLGIIQP